MHGLKVILFFVVLILVMATVTISVVEPEAGMTAIKEVSSAVFGVAETAVPQAASAAVTTL